jgi:hypothetical protein
MGAIVGEASMADGIEDETTLHRNSVARWSSWSAPVAIVLIRRDARGEAARSKCFQRRAVEVGQPQCQARLQIERSGTLVKSIASFPYIGKSY